MENKKENHGQKTKSCYLCKQMIGADGELCPILAERYSKIFSKGDFSISSLLVDILYATCGCQDFDFNSDEKSRQAISDIHMGKAMELLKKHLGANESSKEALELAEIICPIIKVESLNININCTQN